MNRLAKGCFVAVAALAALGAGVEAFTPDADPADVAADNVRYELRASWGEAMGQASAFPLERGYWGVCGYTANGSPYAARVKARPGAKPLLFVAGVGRSVALDSVVDSGADAWCNDGEGLAQ